MNKKLLLVSLLAVGMLVGCKTNNNTSSSASSSADGSSDTGSSDTNTWTGKFGNAGYYLVGEMNGWNNFWKYSGFENFQFKATDDENVFTLTYSVTAEFLASEAVAGDTAGAVDYKVMYWDGNKAPSAWYPDGVANNGVISEAGEYTFTFTLNTTEEGTKTDGSGEKYKLYTKAERIGDAKTETAFVQGDARKFEATYSKVTFRISVEDGLTIPEGKALFIYTWGLVDAQGNKLANISDGNFYAKTTKSTTSSSTVYEYTTDVPVVVDDGTLVGVDIGFCLIVDDATATEPNWDCKVTNSATSNGNYGISVTKTKHSGTDYLKKADLPYWTKGETYNPYTVEELKTAMDADGFDKEKQYCVTGTVTNVSYNSKFNSYTLDLEVPLKEKKNETATQADTDAEDSSSSSSSSSSSTIEYEDPTYTFQIYSGVLGEKVWTPKEGATIKVKGYTKIFTGGEGTLPCYEIAYDSTHKVSPEIYDVVNPFDYLYVKGGMNEWSNVPTGKLAQSDVENVYSVTMTVAADVEFKVANADWSWEFGGNAEKGLLTIDEAIKENVEVLASGNLKTKAAGTYTFTLDARDADKANWTCTMSAAK